MNVRPTPAIRVRQKELTPDMIAWGKEAVLIIECSSVEPNPDADIEQIRRYLGIPPESIRILVKVPKFTIEGILVYFDDRLRSDEDATNRLLRKISLEKDIIVWSCARGLQIKLAAGSHSNQDLNSVLRGGLPLDRFPYPQIEVQIDSPKGLFTKLLFKRLWERACRVKDTQFTLSITEEVLADQNYASSDEEANKKIIKAIALGMKYELCSEEKKDRIWRLNFFPDKAPSVESYLKKLAEVSANQRLNEFF